MTEPVRDKLIRPERVDAALYLYKHGEDAGKTGKQCLDYIEALENRIRQQDAEIERLQNRSTQCCMCGKLGLSTVEGDGGSECELSDGRWVCSEDCWFDAVERNDIAAQKDAEIGRLKGMVRVNALRDHPDMSHEDIDAEIEAALNGGKP